MYYLVFNNPWHDVNAVHTINMYASVLHMYIVYRIAQNFGGVILWRIDRFRVLVGENVGEFTIANIATLVNLEFGGVKYWRMVFGLPNPPIVSSAKKLRYTVDIS